MWNDSREWGDRKTRSRLIPLSFSLFLGSTVSDVYHGAAREDECVLSRHQRAYIEAEQKGTFLRRPCESIFANLGVPKVARLRCGEE